MEDEIETPTGTWNIISFVPTQGEPYSRDFFRDQVNNMRMALEGEAKQENVDEAEPNQCRCVFCQENEATRVGVACGHTLYSRNCAEDIISHPDYAYLYYDEEKSTFSVLCKMPDQTRQIAFKRSFQCKVTYWARHFAK